MIWKIEGYWQEWVFSKNISGFINEASVMMNYDEKVQSYYSRLNSDEKLAHRLQVEEKSIWAELLPLWIQQTTALVQDECEVC